MTLGHQIALRSVFDRYGVQENIALAHYSTLKVGGRARYFAMPNSVKEIAELELAAKEHGLDVHVLSGGSNTLFSDEGFSGLVIKLGPAFDFIEPSNDGQSMAVGAATPFAKVTKMALARGWAHAVGWCGTPGLIGGAVRMNAGTRMGEIKDAISSVHGIKDGQEITYEKNDIEFGYRKSSLPSDLIICQAFLSYDPKLMESVDTLSTKVQEYRLKRRSTQPAINSLGSFFKNPYPLFAAQLIEKCNLKGLKYRGAQISPLHANFIVNNGEASANDILYIASLAQRKVFNTFGVVLSPEIRMVGTFSEPNPLCTEAFVKLPDENKGKMA